MVWPLPKRENPGAAMIGEELTRGKDAGQSCRQRNKAHTSVIVDGSSPLLAMCSGKGRNGNMQELGRNTFAGARWSRFDEALPHSGRARESLFAMNLATGLVTAGLLFALEPGHVHGSR